MGDLLVITPSRGRPEGIRRLLGAVHDTGKLATHIHVAVDDDDPDLPAYQRVMDEAGGPGDVLETGPRKGLAAWTSEIAVRRASEYPYLASFGDDHVPRTAHWDYFLTRAIEDFGGTGFSYPWDGLREDIPEAVVLSSNIVTALGWMCEPSLQHFFVDNVWADLGRGAGCLRHCRAVAVDHIHPRAGTAARDRTYEEASPLLDADREAYYAWRRERMSGDIRKIIALKGLVSRRPKAVPHYPGVVSGKSIIVSGAKERGWSKWQWREFTTWTLTWLTEFPWELAGYPALSTQFCTARPRRSSMSPRSG